MDTELVALIVFGTAAGCTLLGFYLGHVFATKKWSTTARQEKERGKQQLLIEARGQSRVEEQRSRLLELVVNLPETVSRMGAARSTPALCRITVRALMDTVGARRVGLFLAHGTPPSFHLEVYVGPSRPDDELCFELGQGRLGRLAELIGVRSARDASDTWNDLSVADELFKPDLCVCIRRQDTVHAFVALDGVKDEPGNRRLVQMLADNHAVAAEGLKTLHKELSNLEIDPLTGLVNRHHFERRLPEELERAKTYDLALSLFLFDIDDYDGYVERNGPKAGDECIKWVSTVIRKITRGSDVVCRYGHTEFVVVFLGTGSDTAWRHADRIREAIAKTKFPHGEGQPEGFLSVSGGVASYPDDGDEPAILMSEVDAAFIKATESGWNQVHRASEQTEAGAAPLPARSLAEERTSRISESSLRAAAFTGEPGSPDIVLRGAEPIHTPLPVLKEQIPATSSSKATPRSRSIDASPPPIRYSRTTPPKNTWDKKQDEGTSSKKRRKRPFSDSGYLLTDDEVEGE